MASEDRQFLAFNRGVLSSIGLARIDLERYGWAAAVQKNFMPRVLGSMMLRPGMKFIDYMNITGGIGLTRQIPFIFEEDDTIVVSADKDGLALTSGPKIVRETPKDEGDSDDDVPAPARKPAFMNVMNGSSMGQFMGGAPNGGGDGGGFL